MLFFFTLNLYPSSKELSLYKKAILAEEQGDYKNAILFYKEYLKIKKDDFQNDKIQLKIARLTENLDEAIKEYNIFFTNYPKSRFRFLARYELGFLYKLNARYSDAENEFIFLVEKAKGTPYWQKAILEIAELQYERFDFKNAVKNLYILLENIDDYEDVGRAYFLLGAIMVKQGLLEDGEQFFLICAGSFPQCSKAPSSLLELAKLYIKINKPEYSIKLKEMIGQLYPDSPENYQIQKVIKNLKIDLKSIDNINVPLIDLEDEPKLKDKTMARLREDLSLSLEDLYNIKKEISMNNYGIYLQLGYYSDLNNVKDFIESQKKKGIEGLNYMETISSKSGNKFYRVVLGPFKERESANKKLIELKEKNIESMIIEIKKDYE